MAEDKFSEIDWHNPSKLIKINHIINQPVDGKCYHSGEEYHSADRLITFEVMTTKPMIHSFEYNPYGCIGFPDYLKNHMSSDEAKITSSYSVVYYIHLYNFPEIDKSIDTIVSDIEKKIIDEIIGMHSFRTILKEKKESRKEGRIAGLIVGTGAALLGMLFAEFIKYVKR